MPRHFYFAAALLGFFGLFSLHMAWHAWLLPPAQFPVALLLIVSIGPLLLPMRGFLRGNLKSCTWMSYLSLPYFIHGVVESYANAAIRSYTVAEIVFSLMLCLGAGFYVYSAEKA